MRGLDILPEKSFDEPIVERVVAITLELEQRNPNEKIMVIDRLRHAYVTAILDFLEWQDNPNREGSYIKEVMAVLKELYEAQKE